jgi:AraC-like DNA-binding protein
MACVSGSHRRSVELIVRRCQDLAGLMANGSPPDTVMQMHTLAAAIPRDLPMPERLATQQIVILAIGHLMTAVRVETRREMGRAYLHWVTSYSVEDSWSTELKRLIETCAAAIEHPHRGRGAKSVPGARTRRVLTLVERRFSDPRLNLRAVAADCHLSVWHAARLIKRETGASFLAHVHRTRVAAAAHLLKESTLSVKEIATAVGYGSSSQLGRYFKRLRGTTPHQFRKPKNRRLMHTAKTR